MPYGQITVEKNELGRNWAREPEKFEKNRIYFLNKMNPYINKFTKKEREKIYFVHYNEIAKAYIKNKNIKKALYWMIKTKKINKSIIYQTKSAVVYLKKRRYK